MMPEEIHETQHRHKETVCDGVKMKITVTRQPDGTVAVAVLCRDDRTGKYQAFASTLQ
jgi:hypothetical protein